jgi:alpha-D-xyloside xylohydrolase
VEDEYLFGDRMLVAPVFAKQTSREIVLPQGAWCDYWTGEVVEGGRKFTVQTSLDRIPVYVKSGSVFAVAEPGPSWRSPESRRLTVRIYGDGSIPFSIRERGKSVIEITWNHQTGKGSFQQRVPTDAPYTVVGWKKMGS